MRRLITIAAILRKLFDGVVVREDIAMNATKQGNGYFQNGNKEVIC